MDGVVLSLFTHFFVGYSLLLTMIIVRFPISVICIRRGWLVPDFLHFPGFTIISLAVFKEAFDHYSYGVFDFYDIYATALGIIAARLVFWFAQNLVSESISQEPDQSLP